MALYPPIVASSMPAFDVQQESVRIYFSLSDYGSFSIDKIQGIQVTVRRQSSNVNVLNDLSGIAKLRFNKQNYDSQTGLYYIDIFKNSIAGGFQADVVYKAQLRFSSDIQSTAIENLSQWSTVCIIKPVKRPDFYIDEFYTKGQEYNKDDINTFSYDLADFTGIYEQNQSSQSLKSWRVRLYSRETNELLADSDWNLVSAYNYNPNTSNIVFECSLNTRLQNLKEYKVRLDIETRNGYTSFKTYKFNCNYVPDGELKGTLTAAVNQEQGYIKLQYNYDTSEMYTDQENVGYVGNLVIRRTSAESNYSDWQDLKNFTVSGPTQPQVYYDFTAQSGMSYKYLIQKRDPRGRRSSPKETGPIIAEWEHAYLLEASESSSLNTIQQLKLKFDFQISSYKTNIGQSRIDTIGSKYPFIRRNGKMYYRSFPITGTITAIMDNTDLFTSSQQMFQNYLSSYNTYKGKYDDYINRYDYTYQRKFRERVEEFLYNSKPKLYKSMQQGNILIKLMQVSETPKNELSRLVYTFSATAYEIDKPTIKNLDKYGFIHIGTYSPNIVTVTDPILRQITSYTNDDNPTGNVFKAGYDIIGTGTAPAADNSIATLNNYKKSIDGNIITGINISWLRLTIDSQPYLIYHNGTKWVPVQNVPNMDRTIIQQRLYQMRSIANSNDLKDRKAFYLGTLFELNPNSDGTSQQIIIAYPNDTYEIQGNFLASQFSLVPVKDTIMTIDYVASFIQQQDTSTVASMIRNQNINSYLQGMFNYEYDVIRNLEVMYSSQYYDSSKRRVVQSVQGVSSIQIEAPPRTKISIQIDGQDKNDIILNETGFRNFDLSGTDSVITSFTVIGRQGTEDEGVISEPVECLIYYLVNIVKKYYDSDNIPAEENEDQEGSTELVELTEEVQDESTDVP